jgi:hypothetical protein
MIPAPNETGTVNPAAKMASSLAIAGIEMASVIFH